MKTMRDRLKLRMRKDRPMSIISLRIPDDVIEDLKEVAPTLGFSGYQPLMRAYIGQGLRKDLARLENSDEQRLTESLRRQGISDEIIATALAEAKRTVVSTVAEDEVALVETI